MRKGKKTDIIVDDQKIQTIDQFLLDENIGFAKNSGNNQKLDIIVDNQRIKTIDQIGWLKKVEQINNYDV